MKKGIIFYVEAASIAVGILLMAFSKLPLLSWIGLVTVFCGFFASSIFLIFTKFYYIMQRQFSVVVVKLLASTGILTQIIYINAAIFSLCLIILIGVVLALPDYSLVVTLATAIVTTIIPVLLASSALDSVRRNFSAFLFHQRNRNVANEVRSHTDKLLQMETSS